jgi:hypothetical protein
MEEERDVLFLERWETHTHTHTTHLYTLKEGKKRKNKTTVG